MSIVARCANAQVQFVVRATGYLLGNEQRDLGAGKIVLPQLIYNTYYQHYKDTKLVENWQSNHLRTIVTNGKAQGKVF